MEFKYTDGEMYCLTHCVPEIAQASKQSRAFSDKMVEGRDTNNGFYMEAQFRECAMLEFQHRLIMMCEANEFPLAIAVRLLQACFNSGYDHAKEFLKEHFDEDVQKYLFPDSKWYKSNIY